MEVHETVEMVQSGLKWWTNRPAPLSSELLNRRGTSNEPVKPEVLTV